MRMVLTNLGGTGDIWPFLALAVELRRNKHDPILMLSPNFAPLAKQMNVTFIPIGPEFRFEDFRHMIAGTATAGSFLEQAYPLAVNGLQALPQMFRELVNVCRDADMIIGGAGQPAARMVHETLNIPFVSIHYAGFVVWSMPAVRQAVAPIINVCRMREGLPPLRDPLTADAHSSQLAIYAISRHVMRPPRSWPAHYHVAGYFFLDDEGWQPDPALIEFLATGERPIAISFGSAMHDDPDVLTDLLLEAIHRVGCRAIIQQGWSGLGKRPTPSNVHITGFTSHNWLFPRTNCVVHHGATGTTAATFRAGVPAVFVPHAFEQPLNAELARELGCAGAAIPYKQITAKRLAAAISTTLSTPRYYEKSTILGQQIREENGVQTALQLIEQLPIMAD